MDAHFSSIVLDPNGTDIQGEAARIRDRGPATLIELPGRIRAWAITDPELLKELLVDPRVSKDPRQHWPAFINGAIDPTWPLYMWVAPNNMFTAYGSAHRRLRKFISPAFSARRTNAMREWIAAITDELLTNLSNTSPGETVDLREGFAYPLPIRVISELMGVPHHLHTPLRRCVDELFDTSPQTPEQSAAKGTRIHSVFADLVAYRRAHPGDDMTSLLINQCDGENSQRSQEELIEDMKAEQLTEQELIDTLLLVLSAGHETTVNLFDHAIFALLTHLDQYTALRTGHADWADVVEETLRFEAPIAHLPLRYAVDDIDLNGIIIARGDPILASYAAANRDPKTHGPDADLFDITRTDKTHLSFGHGAHHCLGASLARLEATIALPALFDRFPNLRLATDNPTHRGTVKSFISNGHAGLPVHLT
ncbi:cytochrome P450 family protein [Nocardia australiensis]|uniref:cytochrome P450 family protein n=1 Tax=Nocardia australiensis TaxID=2887191 RepID=UPI001D1343AA|nr:cytochrome P450 [Nocardia australiensis]